MVSTSNLFFLNHASFAIERESEILLVDPWYEGAAFYNGWALLDTSISNRFVINWLKNSNKKIFIWYSHEHSDHFSLSFLKIIKAEELDLNIIFQKTLDGRVSSFLSKQGFKVVDAKPGKSVLLGDDFSITTWPYRGGDSFCLINVDGKSLLNLNDCVISTLKEARAVKRKTDKCKSHIDILMTQFGYANWVGNEYDKAQRIKLASHKIDRILLQESVLEPRTIIPFASFVYFCHGENFYLNDAQNSPTTLKEANQLSQIQDKIFFMKPWDKVILNDVTPVADQLNFLSSIAIQHWERLRGNISPLATEVKNVELGELADIFLMFRKRMSINFLFLPQLFELIRVIKPINILIIDINKVVTFSYLRGIKFNNDLAEWHISTSSEVLSFIFKNDFGFNTTHVNGRFRLGVNKKIFDVIKFFTVQEFYKNGFGIKHPFTSIKFFVAEFLRLILKIFGIR